MPELCNCDTLMNENDNIPAEKFEAAWVVPSEAPASRPGKEGNGESAWRSKSGAGLVLLLLLPWYWCWCGPSTSDFPQRSKQMNGSFRIENCIHFDRDFLHGRKCAVIPGISIPSTCFITWNETNVKNSTHESKCVSYLLIYSDLFHQMHMIAIPYYGHPLLRKEK